MATKIQNLFDIKKTQIELVRDRGYVITPEEEGLLTATFEQFQSYMQTLKQTIPNSTDRARLSRSYANPSNTKNMAVFFISKTDQSQKQIPSEVITVIVNRAIESRLTELLLIADIVLSTRGNELLQNLTMTKWQIFFDHDLVYNPTKSVDVPHHEPLTPEQAAIKLREWRADISRLLIFESSDPIVKYYGWSPGTIIRVYRDDNNVNTLAAKSINYRVVIK
jgi:DNA-directed RNA polymerase subunit H (RpoH/RPB5)